MAAVVDHWVNYLPRFERDGEVVWPDEFWVADSWAKAIARQTLPPIPIRQLDNIYLLEQLAQVSVAPGDGTLLYVLEPVRNDWNRGIAGEFQALNYALEHLDLMCEEPFSRIVLRPHPSEPDSKYIHYLEADSRITIDSSLDICMAISRADVVMGVESFALTLALAAGRPVFSSLPPWAHDIRLPQNEIVQIRSMFNL